MGVELISAHIHRAVGYAGIALEVVKSGDSGIVACVFAWGGISQVAVVIIRINEKRICVDHAGSPVEVTGMDIYAGQAAFEIAVT
jgi:hypothetical protein